MAGGPGGAFGDKVGDFLVLVIGRSVSGVLMGARAVGAIFSFACAPVRLVPGHREGQDHRYIHGQYDQRRDEESELSGGEFVMDEYKHQ